MKVRSLLLSMLCLLALGTSFSSCSDDDDSWDDSGSTVTLPKVRAYFLNEGTATYNNAGIAFYAPNGDETFISDIFKKQNNASLGDTGQDMIEYNDCIYVSVYGSNYLVKLNAAGVEQKRESFINDADLAAGIRYIDAEDGYIYASFYGGIIAKINANTLQVEKKLSLGFNLEGVAISEDMLYVANSYKQEGTAYIYLNEVFVVDLHTFTLKETLTVTQNPNIMIEEDDRIFLISWDYSDESYVLQMIEPKNGNKVTKLGYSTHVTANNEMLYWVNSKVDYTNWPETSAINSFGAYNAKTGGTMNAVSFLKNAPEELNKAVIYMIEVNGNNGDIYIGTTGHSNNNGNIYRFKKDGTYVEKFDCGGQNPKTAVFFD